MGSTDRALFAKKLIDSKCYREEESSDSVRRFVVENAVILFDEFEKAHSQVKQSLLSLIDEGHIETTWSSYETNVVEVFSLRKCVIVATSNLFNKQLCREYPMNPSLDELRGLFNNWNEQAMDSNVFSPELIGRFSVHFFKPLKKGDEYQAIVKLKFKEALSEATNRENINYVFDDHESDGNTIACFFDSHENDVYTIIERKCYGGGTNIRGLKHDLQGAFSQVFNAFRNALLVGPLHNLGIHFGVIEDQVRASLRLVGVRDIRTVVMFEPAKPSGDVTD